MHKKNSPQVFSCSCEAIQVTTHSTALLRIACHCTTCQQFNDADFADICIFLTKDIEINQPSLVDYKTYTTPPAVHRGKCIQCNSPALEYLEFKRLPNLTMLPSANSSHPQSLPELSGHIFYHRRVADIHDTKPKISGLMKSQLILSWKLLMKLITKK
jgi:hypothetical protein